MTIALRLRALFVSFLLTGLLVVATPAQADWIRNDILTGNGQARVAPGETVRVAYWVESANNDGQKGCNANDGSPVTLVLRPSGPGAVPSPPTLTFSACDARQFVDIRGALAGNWHINLDVQDAGAGGYNTGGAVFMLHVVAADTLAPVIAAPAGVQASATGPAGATVTYAATATDDSGAATLACAPPSGSTFPLGDTTVTCTATDGAGNAANATFVVTVVDDQAPVIDAAPDVLAEATGSAGATVAYAAPAWSDNVDGSGLAACAPPSGSLFPLGATTVTCDARDLAGNAAAPVRFTLRVVDTTAPRLDLPGDLTVEGDTLGGAHVAWAVAAWDLVDGPVAVSCDAASGALYGVGARTVTCWAADAAGNVAEGRFDVTVTDTTPPALSLPASSSREGDTLGGSHVVWSVSAYDIVDGAVAVACDAASGALFPVGTTTVTCTATDANGNVALGSFDVTVTDTTPPALSLPASWTTDATSGAGASPTWSASANDIIDGPVAVACDPASGSALPMGTTTVTCRATDAAGNTATGSFDVTVWLDCLGPLSPIKLDGGKTTFRYGSTIPIKCKPVDGSAGVSDATIRLTIQKVNANAGNGDITPTTSTSAADTGNVMRWSADGEQYIYNLATKPLSKGTWRVTMDLDGGQTRSFLLGLR